MLRYAEKLTNWRHPCFSHFCWMVWGAGKFVVKTARVYRVNMFKNRIDKCLVKAGYTYNTGRLHLE